ncbi:hypothetical protein AGLY_001498, partial [Aphis glycines]
MEVKSKKFQTVFRSVEKSYKKSDEKMRIFRQNHIIRLFSDVLNSSMTESISTPLVNSCSVNSKCFKRSVLEVFENLAKTSIISGFISIRSRLTVHYQLPTKDLVLCPGTPGTLCAHAYGYVTIAYSEQKKEKQSLAFRLKIVSEFSDSVYKYYIIHPNENHPNEGVLSYSARYSNLSSFLDSERSDECIDFTIGGFRWQSEYPWCIIEVKSKKLPVVFKKNIFLYSIVTQKRIIVNACYLNTNTVTFSVL